MTLGLLKTVPSLFDDFDSLFAPSSLGDYFIDEDSKGFHLSMDLPGIKKEDVKIEIKGSALVIQAESKGKKSRKYSRTFGIPNTVNMDNISADLRDGVLSLTMSKVEEKRRLIQINGP